MSTLKYKGIKVSKGKNKKVKDVLAAEEMLKIVLNGNPFTITMRSPGNEEELIRGLLFTEDIYKDREENPKIKIKEKNNLGYPTLVEVKVDQKKIRTRYLNSRNLLSVSSCGICGKTELEIPKARKQKKEKGERLSASILEKMFLQMRKKQKTFELSG